MSKNLLISFRFLVNFSNYYFTCYYTNFSNNKYLKVVMEYFSKCLVPILNQEAIKELEALIEKTTARQATVYFKFTTRQATVYFKLLTKTQLQMRTLDTKFHSLEIKKTRKTPRVQWLEGTMKPLPTTYDFLFPKINMVKKNYIYSSYQQKFPIWVYWLHCSHVILLTVRDMNFPKNLMFENISLNNRNELVLP